MQRFGIDVSTWQGNPNWSQVKSAGVEFAILRIGYTGSGSAKSRAKDNKFDYNYTECKKVGMPIGVYYFSRAVNYDEGVREAKTVLGWLKDKSLEYPVYIDVEDGVYQAGASKTDLTNAVIGFCKTIEEAGWYAGIYANLSWFTSRMILSQLTAYDKWLAQWSSKPSSSVPCGMWQFGGETNVIRDNHIKGISGIVDMNYAYKDYPSIMKELGLNGYKKSEPISEPIPEPSKPFNIGDVVYPIQDVVLSSNAGYSNPGYWTLTKGTKCIVATYHETNGLYMALKDSNGNYFTSAWTKEFSLFSKDAPIIEQPPVIEQPVEPEPKPEDPVVKEPTEPTEPEIPVVEPTEPEIKEPAFNNVISQIIYNIINKIINAIKKIFNK